MGNSALVVVVHCACYQHRFHRVVGSADDASLFGINAGDAVAAANKQSVAQVYRCFTVAGIHPRTVEGIVYSFGIGKVGALSHEKLRLVDKNVQITLHAVQSGGVHSVAIGNVFDVKQRIVVFVASVEVYLSEGRRNASCTQSRHFEHASVNGNVCRVYAAFVYTANTETVVRLHVKGAVGGSYRSPFQVDSPVVGKSSAGRRICKGKGGVVDGKGGLPRCLRTYARNARTDNVEIYCCRYAVNFKGGIFSAYAYNGIVGKFRRLCGFACVLSEVASEHRHLSARNVNGVPHFGVEVSP